MGSTAPGDAAAFCRAEYPRLVGALDLYLDDVNVAEEIAQEALLRACARWEHVSRLESPGGWTRRVALNLATSHLRRRGVERRAQARLRRERTDYADPDAADTTTVRAAVAALPPKQKAAVVLRYFLDMTATETGDALGCSPQAVRALTARGMARLREVITVEEPSDAT